jgi:hypothetical protein
MTGAMAEPPLVPIEPSCRPFNSPLSSRGSAATVGICISTFPDHADAPELTPWKWVE